MKKDLDSYLLTRQELRIMKIIWKRSSVTVREVCDILSQTKETAYTTVLTLMQILERKGVLKRRRIGRTHHYSPVLLRPQAERNHINDLLNRYFDGNPHRLIEAVLENEFHLGESLVEIC
jgi:BlaI family penicillinase repressor